MSALSEQSPDSPAVAKRMRLAVPPPLPPLDFGEHGPLQVGDRVEFWGESYRVKWRVRAVSSTGRFAICTKPYNLRRTVLYTIVDFVRQVRGPDDLIFGHGYETQEDIDEALAGLEAGDLEVSYRTSRHVSLTIVSVTR